MRYLLIFCLLATIFSCRKKEDTQASGVITGKACYKNAFANDSSQLVPLSFTNIYIRHQSQQNEGYYQTVKTDGDGNFYIENIDIPSVVFVKVRLGLGNGDSAIFTDSVVLIERPQNINLTATLNPATNSFVLRTTDPSGTPIPSATIYLYSNLALATQGGSAGANYTLTTDAYGKAFKTGIPAGTYYLNANREVESLKFSRSLKTVVFKAAGIEYDTIILTSKGPLYQNGFKFTVTDSLGSDVPGASINVYSSLILANINNAAGAVYSLTADNSGKAGKNDITPGTYYVNASIKADTIVLSRIAKPIIINNSGVLEDSIVIR